MHEPREGKKKIGAGFCRNAKDGKSKTGDLEIGQSILLGGKCVERGPYMLGEKPFKRDKSGECAPYMGGGDQRQYFRREGDRTA